MDIAYLTITLTAQTAQRTVTHVAVPAISNDPGARRDGDSPAVRHSSHSHGLGVGLDCPDIAVQGNRIMADSTVREGNGPRIQQVALSGFSLTH